LGKSGAVRKKSRNEKTELVTLKFCGELDKVWPGGHVLLVLTANH